MKPAISYPLNTKDPADREIARQFGLRARWTSLALTVGAGLLLASLFGKVPDGWLLLWFCVTVGLSTLHVGMTNLMMRHLDNALMRPRLMRLLLVTLLVDGVAWGSAPFLCLQTGDTHFLLLGLLMLCAVLSLTLHALCLYLPTLYAFSLPALMPIGVYLCLSGDAMLAGAGLATLFLLGLGLVYGHHLSHTGRDGVRGVVQSHLLATQLNNSTGELRTAFRALRKLSYRDPLTECYNRRALMEHLERTTLTHDRHGLALGLLLVDIDHLKHVNDTQGHLAGDRVLKVVSDRLQKQLRGSDFLARYGGEEFLCVIHVDGEGHLAYVADRVRLAIAAQPVIAEPASVQVTVSVGATLRVASEPSDGLLSRVEQALYNAKQAGRNQALVLSVAAQPPVQSTNLG